MRALLRLLLVLALSASLAACAKAPVPAHPALWSVRDVRGHTGWLFGTIHSAPAPFAWRTPAVGKALDEARTIMVEVGNLRDDSAVAATFARLAKGHGEPPLSQRIDPADRAALDKLLTRTGYADTQFADVETWAAALTLARNADADADAANGVDRAILGAAGSRPVVELEGAARQLGIFDALPEREQRDLLAAVVREASAPPSTSLTESWRKGDTHALEAETRRGLLADPELREALFTQRNVAWSGAIAQAIHAGHRPFVAVGAAHMVGPDGLVARLAAMGLTVERLQ